MILTSKILNKLTNLILVNRYDLLEKIKTKVVYSEEYEDYEIWIYFILNEPITQRELFQSDFHPFNVIDNDLINLLKSIGVKKREITQIYVTVINSDNKIIYG
jgi:hypothetical protein